MRRFLGLLLLLPLCLGCTPSYTIIEHSDLNLPVTGDRPTLVIEMTNGPITITTGGGKTVVGQLTVRGVGIDKEEAEKEIKAIEFEKKTDAEGKIVIKTIRTDGNKQWNSSGTEAQLTVPSHCKLELLTSNGRIQVQGRNQGVLARTRNGSVSIKECGSSVAIQTENGSVTCTNVDGIASIETSNATINLTGRRLLLNCKSSNGSIKFGGDLQAGNHKVQTSNSHITAMLPQKVNLTLEANTSNGRINCDHKLANSTSNRSKNSLKGTIGEGECDKTTLVLKTSNSSISVKRSKESTTVEMDTE